MATYFTDFSSYTAGVAPTGWTERWDTAGSWLVVANVGFGGTKNGLQYTPGTAARHGLSWDVLDADAGRADIEFVYRWQSSVGGAGATNDVRVFARGSGVDATTQANMYTIGSTNTVLRFTKYVAGTGTTTDSAGGGLVANTWYWTRARINGSTIQQRVWADGTTEPTTWAQTVTDTSITGVGWAGVYLSVLASTRMTYDRIGVATAGGTAPTAASAVTVSAGGDVTVAAGAAVSLTASATPTSTGTVATRQWTQVSGPTLTLSGATTATVTFTPAAANKYVLRFTATDTLGGSGTDTATVYVVGTGDSRPTGTPANSGWAAVGAASVDAALADESTATYAESGDNPQGQSFTVDLAPTPAGPKTVYYSLVDSAATPAGAVLVEFLSAGAVVASWNETVGGTLLSQTRVLTDTQNAAVTDPNNIQLRFTATTTA